MSAIDTATISMIKDIVYVATATAGFVLGLLGYIRSREVDRRVRIEPYFRNVWRKLSDKIGAMLKDTEKWLDSIEEELSEDNPEKISDDLKSGLGFSLNDYDWEYDKNIFSELNRYLFLIEKLMVSVKEYNLLRHPTTSTASTLSGLHSIGAIDERSDREVVEEVLKRFKISPHAKIRDLQENPKYMATLNSEILKVKLTLSEIKTLRHSIKRKKSRYDFMFIESNEIA
jgi:hypothetical protein